MPFDSVPKLPQREPQRQPQRQFLVGRTTLQLDNVEGTVVAVESGCLWITMENDSRDIVLTPGMHFEIDRAGRTIVAAEEDSRFGLLAPGEHQDGIAARIARKLAAMLGPRTQPRAWDRSPYY